MSSVLSPGEQMVPTDVQGQSEVFSPNGKYRFVLQADGNLVLYRTTNGQAMWASNTNGQAVRNAIMQGDGNFVIYGFPAPIWASNTVGHPGSFLVVQNDGNVVIYQPNSPKWSTGTNE
ncbi:lectin [Planctomycetota bacterium]